MLFQARQVSRISYDFSILLFFRSLYRRLLLVQIAFLSIIFLSGATFAAAAVVDSSDATKVPQLIQTGGGIPQINIVDPEGGISHNKFEQYNIDAEGVVINNSLNRVKGNGNLGRIAANPKLSGSAKTILFEVTGTSRSELQGTSTIVGEHANFILVNPNGITCNGCEFINIHEVELKTDKLNSVGVGKIKLEENSNGDVYIGKSGVMVQDGSLVLGSDKIKIEGKVSAQKLLKAEAHAAKDREKYAIDISTAALITAGKIYLITTDEGVGVKISTPKFLIDEADKKPHAVITSKENINIETKGPIDIQGSIYAADSIKINGRDISVVDSETSRVCLNGVCAEGGVSDSVIPQIEAGKDLELAGSKIFLSGSKVKLKSGHGFLKMTGKVEGTGDLESGNVISVASSNISLNSVRSQGGVALIGKESIAVGEINAGQKGDVKLYSKIVDVKNITDAQNLIIHGKEIKDFQLNSVKNVEVVKEKAEKDAEQVMDFNITTPLKIDGNFKFTGRNFKNQSVFTAKNVTLDLTGDFLNDVIGNISTGKMILKSKTFTNYNKMYINGWFQVQSGIFVNDNGGNIGVSGPIEIYLTGKREDGNSLYQGSNSVLDAVLCGSEEGKNGIKIIAPNGGIYFGYKKEPTGTGVKGAGFKFIGSELSSISDMPDTNYRGAIYLQSGGDVVFDGAQLIGNITVEAKGVIKEISPTGSYKIGEHSVIQKENRVRTVETPRIETRQVFDHNHCWCPSGVKVFGGCVGGPKCKPVYRTESYTTIISNNENYSVDVAVQVDDFENVVLAPNFAGNKQFFSNKADLVFKAPTASDKISDAVINFLKDMEWQHGMYVLETNMADLLPVTKPAVELKESQHHS